MEQGLKGTSRRGDAQAEGKAWPQARQLGTGG